MNTAPVTMTVEDQDRTLPALMGLLPRLELRANPATLAAIEALVAELPIAGSPAVSLGPVLGMAATILTGGLAVTADASLPDGTWVLSADGRELSRGTVEL